MSLRLSTFLPGPLAALALTAAPVRGRRALAGGLAAVWVALLFVVAPASTAAPAPVGAFTEFTVPTASSDPNWIAAGPDGNLWFTELNGDRIARTTPAGTTTEFIVPTASSSPYGIAAGPDGNLWFTEQTGDRIGRLTPTGTIAEFTVPTASSDPNGIAAGPDGNLWFTELNGNKIGRITPTGTIMEFTVPTASSEPDQIAAGPDGNLWFTELNGQKIGRITPTGTFSEFTVPTGSSDPQGIAAGPDGNIWFTELTGNKIGRITPAGTITEFSSGISGSGPSGIAPGPDGNLWFTEQSGKIGRINPTAGTITEFTVPTASSGPQGIVAGPDGNLWFTEFLADKIAQIGAGAPAASIVAPSVTGSGQQGTQQVCQGDRWSDWAGEQPLVSEYGFDGYQWLRDGTPITGQTAQSYTPVAGDVGHQLSCTITVSYPLLNVTTAATSGAVTVIPPNSGPAGTNGSNGSQGPAGTNGSNGAQGPAGANGANGAAGPQGPPGKVELVSCKTVTRTVTRNHKRVHVTKQVCTTKLVTGPVKFTTAAADERASLSRHGVLYATGYAQLTRAGAQVRLLAARRLSGGRYLLALSRRNGHHSITARYPVTIR
jgi:streptogramin lyase